MKTLTGKFLTLLALSSMAAISNGFAKTYLHEGFKISTLSARTQFKLNVTRDGDYSESKDKLNTRTLQLGYQNIALEQAGGSIF